MADPKVLRCTQDRGLCACACLCFWAHGQIDFHDVDDLRTLHKQAVAAKTDGDNGIGEILTNKLFDKQKSTSSFIVTAAEAQKILDKTDVVSYTYSGVNMAICLTCMLH